MPLVAAPISPLTPTSLAELLSRLPAEVRARVHWAPNALKQSFGRLLHAQTLTRDLIAEVTAEFIGYQVSIRAAIEVLPELGREELLVQLHARLRAQGELVGRLPVDARTAAVRALCTTGAIAGIGLEVIAQSQSEDSRAELQQLLAELPRLQASEAMPGLEGTVLLLAALTGAELDDGSPERWAELCLLADADSLRFASLLAQDDPRLRLPWYFEPATGGGDTRAFALWAEQRAARNARARAALHAWDAEDEAEQKDSWEALRRALDEDRTSDRQLFPSTTS